MTMTRLPRVAQALADFDLDPSWWHLDEVCRQTERRKYQGRVAIGMP
jgi:hypothetical protein